LCLRTRWRPCLAANRTLASGAPLPRTLARLSQRPIPLPAASPAIAVP
jgi:hypothetical protein